MQRKLRISAADKIALEKVKLSLEENPSEWKGIIQLCKFSGLNGEKLKRGFKILYGTTVYRYFFSLRMKEAERLLCATEKTIAEIAFIIGYEGAPAFCAAFKIFYGVSPLQFRLLKKQE